MGFLFLLCVLEPVVVGGNSGACWLWGTVSAVPAPALAESCLQEVADKDDPGPTPAWPGDIAVSAASGHCPHRPGPVTAPLREGP